MAETLEKQEFKKNLVESFKFAQSKGSQIVDLITALKTLVQSDRQSILDSTLLDQTEKDEWRAEYNTKLLAIKTSIQNALDA